MQIQLFEQASLIKNGSIEVCEKIITESVQIHSHDFYELEIFLSSGGNYTVNGKTYPIERGSLFFLSPASFHCCEFPPETHLFNIMFTLNLADTNLLYHIFSNAPYFNATIPSEKELNIICGICSLMEQYDVKKRPLSFLIPLLNSLLGEIYFLTELQNKDFYSISPLQRSVLYIQANFNKDITLDDVATVAGMSNAYFSDRFRAYIGTTFKKYVLNMRLDYAKKLLIYTDLSITNIALESGFNDFSNFMSLFKKTFSKTPRQYRIENKDK